MTGFWNTLTKKLSGDYSEEQMIFSDNIPTFIICLVLALIFKENVPNISSLNSYIWIIIFSITSLLTSILLVKGFSKVEASIGSLILPMEIVFASIIGFIFLNERLSINIYIGGALIFLATILPYVNMIILERKRKEKICNSNIHSL
ncbi:MAG: EamA family transporter [Candidatus Dojkabacteria bacterium]